MSRLKEWVDSKGNLVKLNSQPTAPHSTNYKQKFKKIIEYFEDYCDCDLSKDLKYLYDTGFDLTYGNQLEIFRLVVTFDPNTEKWTLFQIKNYPANMVLNNFPGKGFDQLLDSMENLHIIHDRTLCETIKENTKMQLHEEFKLYESLWDSTLLEWKDMNGSPINKSTSSTSTSNTTASTVPNSISQKINKIKAASPGLGNYKKVFTELCRHLNTIHDIDFSYKYFTIGEQHLCVCFTTDSDITYYLDVTTTKINSSTFKFEEYWDYVLEEMEPNNHILDRGYIKDYDQLLDKLMQYGLITNKSACK